MFELHAVERQVCPRIPGGLVYIDLVDPDDLTVQPDWDNAPDATALQFKEGKSAYRIGKDLRTGKLEGPTDTAKPGDFIVYNLNFSIRNIRPRVESLRARLRNRRVHVVVTYRDGSQRLLRSMRIYGKDESGNTILDRQGYQFSGNTRMQLPYINVAVPDPAPPMTGVDIEIIATSGSSTTFTVPAGKWLAAIEIKSDQVQSASVGFSAGATDLAGGNETIANQTLIVQCNNVATHANYTLYFSNLHGNNTIKIWLITQGNAFTTSMAAFNFTIPTNRSLLGFETRSNAGQTVLAGQNAGGFDIAYGYAGANEAFVTQAIFASFSPFKVYLSGLVGNNVGKYWLLSNPVSAVVTTSDFIFNLPAEKMLVRIEIAQKTGGTQTIRIGKTPGASDYAGPITMGSFSTLVLPAYWADSFTNSYIYLSGLSGTNTIKLWFLE